MKKSASCGLFHKRSSLLASLVTHWFKPDELAQIFTIMLEKSMGYIKEIFHLGLNNPKQLIPTCN